MHKWQPKNTFINKQTTQQVQKEYIWAIYTIVAFTLDNRHLWMNIGLLFQGEPGSHGMLGMPGPPGFGYPGSKVNKY